MRNEEFRGVALRRSLLEAGIYSRKFVVSESTCLQ